MHSQCSHWPCAANPPIRCCPVSGVDTDAVVQQLTGRGPCPNPAQCFLAPCSLPGACPAGRVCLNDYCGGCNVVCPQRAALCHVMLRLDPTAACPM